MNDRYTFHVKNKNSIIIFKNKQLRTPVVFKNISASQLTLLEQQAKFRSLTYEITVEKQVSYEIDDIFVVDDTELLNLPNPLIIDEEEKDENEKNRYNIW